MIARNILGQLTVHCSYGLILVLGGILCYMMHTNTTLSARLQEEQEKNQRYRDLNRNCDQELKSQTNENLIKDNKTATLWSNVGKLENQIAICNTEKTDLGKYNNLL